MTVFILTFEIKPNRAFLVQDTFCFILNNDDALNLLQYVNYFNETCLKNTYFKHL